MSGEWNTHYADLTEPILYGDVQSYRIATQFVDGRGLVEDWGCGGGGLKTFLAPEQPYRGIDGSSTPFADVIVDLADYRSHDAECIVLRHVLEHSHRWSTILDNAVQSFRSRLCVVLFTPTIDETRVISTEPDYSDVPVIAFALDDLLAKFHGLNVKCYEIEGSHYGVETIIKVRR